MEENKNNKKKDQTLIGFSRRTINELIKTWHEIKGMTRRAVTGKINPDLPKEDEKYMRKLISDCVFDKGGEISSRSKAVEIGMIYLNLSKEGRGNFLQILASKFDIDRNLVKDIFQRSQNSKNKNEQIDLEMELSKALIPPRIKLLKQFNSIPNGFKFLIDFRADLLPIRKKNAPLKKLNADLKRLLSSWFDIGLLNLIEITWESSASLLEKLIEYEAVHEIQSWSDLKNRLDSDRYCFAFFHNKVPEEPLIFVEVALANKIPDSIQKLLDENAETIKPEQADTAIFYSISNSQRGLAGINLGNFLVKRVVKELSLKLKKLKHFVTLSPIPGFRKWLDPILHRADDSFFYESELKALRPIVKRKNISRGLLEILNSNWQNDDEISRTLKPILMSLCTHYLIKKKRGKKAMDAVANFHLTNGASLKRLNWLGDTSEKGMNQSAGIMVNYYYDLSDIEKNHERYITKSHINISKDIKPWLRKTG